MLKLKSAWRVFLCVDVFTFFHLKSFLCLSVCVEFCYAVIILNNIKRNIIQFWIRMTHFSSSKSYLPMSHMDDNPLMPIAYCMEKLSQIVFYFLYVANISGTLYSTIFVYCFELCIFFCRYILTRAFVSMCVLCLVCSCVFR